MTVTPTYPGVYIREIPSGSRTITGVATSITAFVGTAPRGPVDEPVPISGFGQFERVFGGLWRESGLGYAVRDFFTNGGSDALVVRVVHATDDTADASDVVAATARVAVGANLTLEATGPGVWGNALQVTVTHPDATTAAEVATAQGVGADQLFGLVISEGSGPDAPRETYLNVTLTDGPQRLDLVLAASALVRVRTALPAGAAVPRPAEGLYTVADLAVDGVHLIAVDPRAWAPGVKATVAHPDPNDQLTIDTAAAQGVTVDDLFHLTLQVGTATPEENQFVTVVPGPRRVDAVLRSSAIARTAALPLPAVRPAAGDSTVAAGVVHAGVDGSTPTATDYVGNAVTKTGLNALLKADLFNILCIPPPTLGRDVATGLWAQAAAFCAEHRAFLIVDPPATSLTLDSVPTFLTAAGLNGTAMRNAALYFPRIQEPDPLRGGATGTFAACGAIAGTFARTDGARGVWKAPAGIEAALTGVVGLRVSLTDDENGALNPAGINCLRTFRGVGPTIWGARTLRGADLLTDEYKYIPVRRLALFLEETLYRNTQWVVFEPNDEPLWAQIRLSVNAFMQDLFRRGAFQGLTPKDAYFVRCDKDTTTQYDIDRGIVNVLVGFAPLKPAEFVVIGIQQKTASATA